MTDEEHLLEHTDGIAQFAANPLLQARDLRREAGQHGALAIGERADERVGQLEWRVDLEASGLEAVDDEPRLLERDIDRARRAPGARASSPGSGVR